MKIFLTKTAQKQLDKLPDAIAKKIIKSILVLESDPYPTNSKKLVGMDNFRLRIGSYRVLYYFERDSGKIIISRIAHRSVVYRK